MGPETDRWNHCNKCGNVGRIWEYANEERAKPEAKAPDLLL